MTKLEKADFIVSELNGFMDGVDAPFWAEEYECPIDEIVSRFGFGYTNDGTIYYMTDKFNMTEVQIPLDKLYDELLHAQGHIDEMRTLIFWIEYVSE